MQTTGHLISTATELSSGVQHSQYRFDSTFSSLRVNIRWDAAAVVPNLNAAVGQHSYTDFISISCQGFVNTVVYNLPQQMMQTLNTGTADIHTGPLADG